MFIIITLSAVGLVITAVAAFGRRPWSALRRPIPLIMTAVLAAFSFQVTHFLEHIIQLGHWTFHRTEKPFLTPWAESAAASLADATLGVELLHLLGNVIFLAGALALVLELGRSTSLPGRTAARRCLLFQTLHVTEHVALTLSVAAIGTPLGVSTLFGLADPGAAAWTYRVWLHFTINLIGTAFALQALHHRRTTTPEPQPEAMSVSPAGMAVTTGGH